MWCKVAVLGFFLTVPLFAGQTVWQADFEQGQGGQPTGWRFDAQRGDVAGTWDAAEPAGGHSLRLQVKAAGGRATWTCTERLPLKPATNYRLRLKVLRANVQPGGRAYVILYENGLEYPDRWHVTPFWGGTQDWVSYTLSFRTREEASWGRLQCKLWEAPGYAWFDDLVLEELGPDETLPEVFAKQRPAPADDGAPVQVMWYPAQRRPDSTLHLLPGLLNPVAFFPWGRKAEVAAPYLIVETPPQVTLQGPVTSSREPIPEAVTLHPQRVSRGGQPAWRWRVPLPEGLLQARLRPSGPEWTAYHFLYVRPEAGCPEQFTWIWQTECGGKLGPRHEIPARLENCATGKLARVPAFPLYAQHSDALRLPTGEQRQAVLDYLAYAAIEGGLSLGNYQREYHALDQELQRQGFHTWEWLWDGYSQKGGEGFPLVYDTPKGQAPRMCPQAQAERVEPWWSNLQASYRSRLAPDSARLIINFEPPVFNCCFCERCRQAFAAFAKLPPAQVATLTPQQIQQLPDDSWGRFRAQQNAQIVKNHITAVHAANPRVAVGLCGPPRDDWTARRGMDIRLFEPEVGFHAPMIYEVGTTYADLVRATCENTTAPVLPFVLASDLVVAGVFPTAEELRTNLLVTAASGGRGAVLWVGIEALDGELMNALRQSLHEIALLEPYLKDARRSAGLKLDVPPQRQRTLTVDGQAYVVSDTDTSTSALRQWAWESPRGRLVLVANYDEQSPRRVDAPDATRLFGPPLTTAAGQTVLNLPPGAVAALVWP